MTRCLMHRELLPEETPTMISRAPHEAAAEKSNSSWPSSLVSRFRRAVDAQSRLVLEPLHHPEVL